MLIKRHHLTVIGVAGLAMFAASACNLSFDIGPEGSGDAETVSYDFDGFNEVDISNAFEADITVVEGPPSIEVTLDDNLFEHLEIGVDGDELKIEMKRDNVDHNVQPNIVITMPELVELDVSGASSVTVAGVESEELRVDVSGASEIDIAGQVDRLQLDTSGASEVNFAGAAQSLKVETSGASTVDFTDATIGDATVDLSGASELLFDSLDRIVGEASGASIIEVPQGTSASIEASGLSIIERN